MASIFAWATGADVMQVLAAGLGATLFIVGMTALFTLGAVLRDKKSHGARFKRTSSVPRC